MGQAHTIKALLLSKCDVYGENWLNCDFLNTDFKSMDYLKLSMTPILKQNIIEVCDQKILRKGETVGLSFYAFFKNKNDDPLLLMEAATWWIETHELDHFEKAVKVKQLILDL